MRIVIIADAHLEHDEEPHPSYKLVKKWIKANKPEFLILNGDILSFDYLSHYTESLFQLREGKRLSKDMVMMQRELDFFQKYSKELIYLQGNHCRRLEKRVQALPDLAEGILSVDKLLKLEQRGIPWIPEIEQPIPIKELDLFVMHGTRYSVHYAAATLREYMVNIVVGHAHRHQAFAMKGLDREITCWGSGCLCSKNPDYLNGKMNQWINGFVVIDSEAATFSVNNIIIDRNNSFILDKKLWKL